MLIEQVTVFLNKNFDGEHEQVARKLCEEVINPVLWRKKHDLDYAANAIDQHVERIKELEEELEIQSLMLRDLTSTAT